jgi:hypothetical protein
MRLEMLTENKRSQKCFKFSLPYVKNVGTMVHIFQPLVTRVENLSQVLYLNVYKTAFFIIHGMLKRKFQISLAINLMNNKYNLKTIDIHTLLSN